MESTAAPVGGLLFKFDVLGDVQMQRKLVGVMANTEDFRPAFERMAPLLRAHLEKAFETSGGATAGPWAPLSKRYARWKARNYPGAPILTRTGALRRSLTEETAPGHLVEVTEKSLTFGTTLQVGNWYLGSLHQQGTTRGMPPRWIFNLPLGVKRALMRVVREHVRAEE